MRLFIALNFPDAIRRELWSAIEPIRDAPLPITWVRPEGIHLTLKFLGHVADARAPEMFAALSRAASGTRPLPLTLGGFGAFPDLRAPRVVWVGLESPPGLELLQHHVEREFAPLGFPTEPRPFRPHVTLGRAARAARARDFPGLGDRLAAIAFQAAVLVETVDLMQSVLQRGGAVYQVRHNERLS